MVSAWNPNPKSKSLKTAAKSFAVMGLYQHLRQTWQSDALKSLIGKRMIEWRREPATIRIRRPTRLDRARALGYRAKPGIVVVRQRVSRGGRMRPDIRKGRRSKHSRQRKILSMSYQLVAERRAASKFPNLEVLNSYFVAKDGLNYWYEIIMVDNKHPAILADKQLSWTDSPKNRRRVFRGLTSAGRKSRGLRHKGRGAEKLRPSLRAHDRKGK